MTTLQPIQPNRPLYWSPLVEELAEKITAAEVYLVGGTVRDVYMRRPAHDLDLTTPQDGRKLARHIANLFNGAYYALDDERGVGRALIVYDGEPWVIDVARFRGDSLANDLCDRDFTMNAIAVALDDLAHVLDPLDGIQAIEQKYIQLCKPESIADDPVRALRAVRQSLVLKMKLTPETVKAVKRNGVNLTQTSPERVRDEFFKLLDTTGISGGLQTLDVLDLLALILPEIEDLKGLEQSHPHVFDVWRHTLSVVDYLDRILTTISPLRTDNTASSLGLGMIAFSLADIRRDLQTHIAKINTNERSHRALLILAALAHDIAKPATFSVGDDGRIHNYKHEFVGADMVNDWGERLRLSNEETRTLSTIVRHHMRPHHLHVAGKVSKRAQYRFWRDTGEVGVDICLLAMADFLGKYGTLLNQDEWIKYVDVIRILLEGYYLQPEELVSFIPLVDGNDLQKHFDLTPSPIIGQMLKAVHEAQAVGEITTQDKALAWLADWSAENTPED